MPDKVEATQYYPSDLSHLLNIGEIIEMHVTDNGRGTQVLRIVSKPIRELARHEELEYRTVKPKQVSGGTKRPSGERASKPTGPKKGILGTALSTVFGDDYRDQKPPWMD
jgi:hypothetical protein